MSSDLLIELLSQHLDPPQYRFKQLRDYYAGNSPLSYMSPEAKRALVNIDRMSSNLCRTVVVSLQERLRLARMDTSVGDGWALMQASNLDQLATRAHRDALVTGNGMVLCWTDALGRPRATIESPEQVAVQRNLINTEQIDYAVKRVRTKLTTEVWIYTPDEVQHWRANTPGAGTAGFTLVETVVNPLGVVPVVPIGLSDAESALTDVISIQDALNKYLLDSLVASEFSGRPRRWATGIESLPEVVVLDDDGSPVLDDNGEPVVQVVNPFPEENRMMVATPADARIGQLDPTNLSAFESGVRVIIGQAMMVTGLPAHYVGTLQNSPSSADAIRGAEAALVSRAEAFQRAYGLGWERVGQLLVAMDQGVDPDSVTAKVGWSPADTRSQAQEADAVVKLVQAGVLPVTYALSQLGYSDDEIRRIRSAKRSEVLDAQGVGLSNDSDTL